MTLEEYQQFVESTSRVKDNKYWYTALGIGGEAGEILDEVKKSARKDFADIEDRKPKIILEMGDCLWYIARMCNELGITLHDVISGNVEKLTERKRLLGPTE